MGESKEASPTEAANEEPAKRARDPVGQFFIVFGAGLTGLGLLMLLILLAVLAGWLVASGIAAIGLLMLLVGVVIR